MPKAYVFTEYGDASTQQFQDLPTPTPGPAELRVKVHAAGVNPVDWKLRTGHLKDSVPVDFPAILGGEVAGVVQEVGQDVDGFAVGDQVIGVTAPTSGGYTEESIVTAASAAKKPAQVSFTDAAALPIAGTTAYDAIRQFGLRGGQTLLINGIGGGVGVVAAQLARDAGVNVIGIASDAKRPLVESLDATLVTSGDGVADRVRQLLPDGVDGILDLVGGQALRDVAGLAQDRAKVISASDPATANDVGGAMVEHTPSADVLAAVAALVAEGKLSPHVLDILPFDEAGQALASVEAGHSQGKVVLSIA